jgi:membrane-associated phospholipid phosphatase
MLGNGPVAVGFFILYFCFSTREKAFYILLVHTFIGTINLELKIIYHNPRPYMTEPNIIPYNCSKSFGNPSGHCSLTSCFFLTLFLMIFHDKDYALTASN